MDQAAASRGGSRFSRRRAISLEEATPELMEALPGTAIRLSAAQVAQLEQIERAGGWDPRQGAEREPAATI
jgi:hypothetical protein